MSTRNGQPTKAEARELAASAALLSQHIKVLAERRPELEPVLLNLARTGKLQAAEDHIIGLRKYRARAAKAAKR